MVLLNGWVACYHAHEENRNIVETGSITYRFTISNKTCERHARRCVDYAKMLYFLRCALSLRGRL